MKMEIQSNQCWSYICHGQTPCQLITTASVATKAALKLDRVSDLTLTQNRRIGKKNPIYQKSYVNYSKLLQLSKGWGNFLIISHHYLALTKNFPNTL